MVTIKNILEKKNLTHRKSINYDGLMYGLVRQYTDLEDWDERAWTWKKGL